MAALLVAGFVGLFSETALNIAFTDLSKIFSANPTTIQWLATGLILLPGNLLNCILAPTIGRLFDKYGPKAVITPGTILVVIGYILYAPFGTETAIWAIVLTHVVMMLGIGAVLASVQTNTLNSLPKQYSMVLLLLKQSNK